MTSVKFVNDTPDGFYELAIERTVKQGWPTYHGRPDMRCYWCDQVYKDRDYRDACHLLHTPIDVNFIHPNCPFLREGREFDDTTIKER